MQCYYVKYRILAPCFYLKYRVLHIFFVSLDANWNESHSRGYGLSEPSIYHAINAAREHQCHGDCG